MSQLCEALWRWHLTSLPWKASQVTWTWTLYKPSVLEQVSKRHVATYSVDHVISKLDSQFCKPLAVCWAIFSSFKIVCQFVYPLWPISCFIILYLHNLDILYHNNDIDLTFWLKNGKTRCGWVVENMCTKSELSASFRKLQARTDGRTDRGSANVQCVMRSPHCQGYVPLTLDVMHVAFKVPLAFHTPL